MNDSIWHWMWSCNIQSDLIICSALCRLRLRTSHNGISDLRLGRGKARACNNLFSIRQPTILVDRKDLVQGCMRGAEATWGKRRPPTKWETGSGKGRDREQARRPFFSTNKCRNYRNASGKPKNSLPRYVSSFFVLAVTLSLDACTFIFPTAFLFFHFLEEEKPTWC